MPVLPNDLAEYAWERSLVYESTSQSLATSVQSLSLGATSVHAVLSARVAPGAPGRIPGPRLVLSRRAGLDGSEGGRRPD